MPSPSFVACSYSAITSMRRSCPDPIWLPDRPVFPFPVGDRTGNGTGFASAADVHLARSAAAPVDLLPETRR
jgi:hypothetical protein